jgi:hypothetical protein
VTKKKSPKRKPISEKQRISDEKLKDELRKFNLTEFDKALDKAIKSAGHHAK